MNLAKGIVATLLLGGVVVIEAWHGGSNPLILAPDLFWLLAASGVVGLGIGDTCFFAALNRLGSRRALLLFMLAPVLTSMLAWPILGESLSWWQVSGIALTCGGVVWVIAERSVGQVDGSVEILGVSLALGAALCQAIGALMSRYVFDHADYGAASSALVRLVPGTLMLVFLLPFDRRLHATREDRADKAEDARWTHRLSRIWVSLGLAVLLGTFLGIWLQQIAFKYSGHVGVASTLLATSPLFVLPMVAWGGERISARAVTGAVIGIIGVAVLLTNPTS
jgi:drug/metabolite transporter (DMT)-like permease